MAYFAWVFLLIGAVSARSDTSQLSVQMPQPSGPFAVGRVGYDWVDPARPEVLSKVPNASREIIVDVWYPAAPAKSGARTARYFPDAEKIDKSLVAQAERNNWGSVWSMIASGNVHTHAYENAPAAPGDGRFPLIILSHAFSGEPYAYTHQIQELVSHGYVVATIHHTYEVTVAMFPDGRMIPLSDENLRRSRIEITGPETLSELHKWEGERVDVWAADIRFTLDQITRLNMAPKQKAPFAGRIDVGRVGVFGHSFGGFAAARACELDQRFKACLNQDGVEDDGPILSYDGGSPPTQPFMFMSEPPARLRDDQLAALHMTRKEADQDTAGFLAKIDKELRGCSGGAYQVWVEIPGFKHNGYSDIPLLIAAGNPDGTAKALRSLRTIESYTNAFFDKFLNGAHDTLLDREPSRDSEVEIRRYSR
jgi:pimeloyl-ACP methyl ester carboxylesterase